MVVFLDPIVFQRRHAKPPVRRVRGVTVAALRRGPGGGGPCRLGRGPARGRAQLQAPDRRRLAPRRAARAAGLDGGGRLLQALLEHLAAYGAEVRVQGGEITVVGPRRDVYIHLPDRPGIRSGPSSSPFGGGAVRRVRHRGASALAGGLPLWAADELTEAAWVHAPCRAGEQGPVGSVH